VWRRPAGPYGTWKGGREKAPAAFCRKAITAQGEVEMWGDGKQTRSFTYIDDCVEGILRITKSDFREPLNLGSTEMVSRPAGCGRRRVARRPCKACGWHLLGAASSTV
jgi:nucleoside-diphosphate-sugar epimerase